MSSILEDLFNGKKSPYDNLVPKNPDFPELAKKVNDTENYFRGLLSDTEKTTFDALVVIKDDLSAMENLEAFSRGFRLAFMIAVDVYYNKGNLPDIQKLFDFDKCE